MSLPATAVGASGGDEIRRYMSAASKSKSPPPTATIIFRGTRVNVRPAPVVASFSARGPNPESPEILKPDVIAPGLNILAAWSDKVGPSGIPSDQRKIEFNILSGTSMACPHVSGLAALLKAAHPEWSSAAIRSALMTTAYTVDNRGEQMIDESTGKCLYRVRLRCRRNADCSGAKRAGHAGNLNYPSLTVVFQQYGKNHMSTHFIRTVTNVGDANSVYRVTIRPPGGTVVTVQPEKLVFRRVGQKLNFLVRVETTAVKLAPGASSMKSGSIIWADGKHTVASPVVVTMQQPL
ncbi:SUBTILISIN-LIKE PROTEASE SBT1.5 [Salix viminalis]|uniref:SUBTILISIN-LIKE PROTEASE SBT1.5 n=1 Tax=Salix viminalis TaxID=40686 RepID=A0A9Q0YYQ5_SALVM|nr:SUBTILISIN-LIKE PROTEASE SBT1.5 [Salix viminalis]